MTLKEEWLLKIKNKSLREVRCGESRFSILTDFYLAPEEIRLDEEITRKVLAEGEFIWNIHDKFRDDKEFIKSIAESVYGNRVYTRQIYKGLSPRLQDDEELLIFLLEKGEKLIYFKDLSPKLATNKALVMRILDKENLTDIPYGIYKTDVEVMKKYILNYPKFVLSLSKRTLNHLVKDEIVLKELLKVRSTYKILPLKYKMDINIIKECCLNEPSNLKHIPPEIMSKELVMELAKENKSLSLMDVPKNILDFDIAKKFIENNGIQLQYLQHHPYSESLELIMLAAETYPNIKIVNKNMLSNREVALAYVQKNAENFRSLPQETREDMEIASTAIKKWFHYYQFAPKSIQLDFDLALEAVQKNAKMYYHVPDELKSNWELIYEVYIQKLKTNNKFMRDLPIDSSSGLPAEIRKEINEVNKLGQLEEYIKSKRLDAYLERTLKKEYSNPKKIKI